MNDNLRELYNIKVTGLALMLNVSAQSINNWYKWKETNPEHKLAKLLPDYLVLNGTRYWCQDDVYKIAEFISQLPKGNSKNSIRLTRKDK